MRVECHKRGEGSERGRCARASALVEERLHAAQRLLCDEGAEGLKRVRALRVRGPLARETRKAGTLRAMMRETLGWEEAVSLKVTPSPGDIRGRDAGGVDGPLGEEVKELGVQPA